MNIYLRGAFILIGFLSFNLFAQSEDPSLSALFTLLDNPDEKSRQ